MANSKLTTAAGTAPATPSPLDVSAEIGRIGLAPEDAARLTELAEAAYGALDAESRERVRRQSERAAEGGWRAEGRDQAMARARVSASYLIALSRTGGAGRAAREMGADLREIWTDVSLGMDALPILRTVYVALEASRDRQLVARSRDVVSDGLEGEQLTRVQERFAPFVLERVARETWAPDRGGRQAGAAPAKGSPASVVINIQSGDAFNVCGKLAAKADAELIDI